MRRLVLVPLALALLSLADAAGVAAAPEGTLTIAMHFTPVTRWLDPAEGESTITPYLMLYALHDGLLKPMPGVGSGPSLAESWSMSKDMLGADFTLRANAKFHNGDPVTAEDVKFSFERYRGGAAKVLKDGVKEIQTPAPNRVRFVFKEPWPDFPAFYGTFVASAGWVVPKKYMEQVGEEGFRKAPVGAGPYKFVSFKPGVELVLEAFEGYWRKVPSAKRLVFKSVPEATTRFAMLKRGEIDVAYLLDVPQAQELKRDPSFKVAFSGGIASFYLDYFDMWDPKSPWADRRVRLAASHAIDRRALNEAETLGQSRPTGGFVPRNLEFALPLEAHAYDPATAKQLLAEAGYPQGFDAGDLHPFPPYTSVGEAVADFRGEAEEKAAEMKIELPVNAHLPHDYVPGERLRLEAYRKLAAALTNESIDEVQAELVDRYGELPLPAQNLVEVARFRVAAREAGLSDVALQGNFIKFSPASLPESRTMRLNRMYPGSQSKPAMDAILIPKPKTARIGGRDLQDAEILEWANGVIRNIFSDAPLAVG